jgi:hypothetical protein
MAHGFPSSNEDEKDLNQRYVDEMFELDNDGIDFDFEDVLSDFENFDANAGNTVIELPMLTEQESETDSMESLSGSYVTQTTMTVKPRQSVLDSLVTESTLKWGRATSEDKKNGMLVFRLDLPMKVADELGNIPKLYSNVPDTGSVQVTALSQLMDNVSLMNDFDSMWIRNYSSMTHCPLIVTMQSLEQILCQAHCYTA